MLGPAGVGAAEAHVGEVGRHPLRLARLLERVQRQPLVALVLRRRAAVRVERRAPVSRLRRGPRPQPVREGLLQLDGRPAAMRRELGEVVHAARRVVDGAQATDTSLDVLTLAAVAHHRDAVVARVKPITVKVEELRCACDKGGEGAR